MESVKVKNQERTIVDNVEGMEGWAIDADERNNPTYPMKHYTGDDHNRLDYERAEQQPANVEILHSIERPGLTRVFGTTLPPRGVSGALRRYAFKFSEGSSAHWMTLILADRVDMVEGIVDDLKGGKIPNFFKESGWNAEWKYNRPAAIRKLAVTAAVTAGLVAWMVINKNDKKKLSSY